MAQPGERGTEDRHVVDAKEEVRQRRAPAYAPPTVVIVWIDRHDPSHRTVMPRREQERDAPPDRLADDHCIVDVERLEKPGHGRHEQLRRVRRPRNIRVSVPRIIERVHAKLFREDWHDALKHVELGAERVQ